MRFIEQEKEKEVAKQNFQLERRRFRGPGSRGSLRVAALWVMGACGVTFGLCALSSCGGQKPSALVPAQKSPSVLLKKLEPEEVSEWLIYPARVVAKNNATILSDGHAVVSSLVVHLGAVVKAQQLLMVLRHTDPIYQYAPMRVLAPIAGTVSALHVTLGSSVNEGQALADVMNPSETELQAEIPAQDLGKISPGVRGTFQASLQETPQEPVSVELQGMSPYVKPGTGTASAKLRMLGGVQHPHHQGLAPGLQGVVSFQLHRHQALLLPESAVVDRGKESFVYVLDEAEGGSLLESQRKTPGNAQASPPQRVKRVLVQLGAKQKGVFEVLQGLKAQSRVVVRSSRMLSDAEPVTVEEDQDAAHNKPEKGTPSP